jgi:flagellar motor switch protein FliM
VANILSQEEIDALLGVVEAETPEAEATGSPSSAPGRVGGQNYLPYDFRRPNRVSKEQLRYFQTIHEAFARQFANALSSYLRSIVDIEIVSADQLTYGEYVLSLPGSTALFIFEMKPLEGSAVLEMNPSLILLMVERLFGGAGGGVGINRDLTTIETAVVTKLVRHGLQVLGDSWERVAPLRPTYTELMKNPQMLQLLPNTETVILVTFELRLGEQSGILSLCYPYLSLEPILPNMSTRGALLGQKRRKVEHGREWIEQRLSDSPLPVSAILGRTDLTVAEFLRLRQGDVIRLDRRVDEAIDVLVGGEPKGMARPGLRGRNRAVRLDSALRRGDLPDES